MNTKKKMNETETLLCEHFLIMFQKVEYIFPVKIWSVYEKDE